MSGWIRRASVVWLWLASAAAGVAQVPVPDQTPLANTGVSSDPAASALNEEPSEAVQLRYREVVDAAIADFEAGRYAEARAVFQRAHELWPSARTLRTLGMTAFELSMYPQAMQELEAALDDPRRPLPTEQRAQVTALLEQTRPWVGRFRLHFTPRAAELTLDGAALGSTTDLTVVLALGEHELRAVAHGYLPLRSVLQVQGREDRALLLVLDPEPATTIRETSSSALPIQVSTPTPQVPPSDPPAPPSLRRVLMLGTLGIGVAGVVTTAVMGGLALERKRELDQVCPRQGGSKQCPPAYADEMAELKRWSHTATAAAVLGAAGLAVAGYLWLRHQPPSERRRALQLQPQMGLGSAGLLGRF